MKRLLSLLIVIMQISDFKTGAVMTELTCVNPGVQMVWSPDSKYLLYFNDGEIWAVDSGTKDKKQLASGVSFVTSLL